MFNALGGPPGPVTWAFAILLSILLPIVAYRQHRAMTTGALTAPRRPVLYLSALATHLLLLVGVVACILADELWLFPSFTVDGRNVLTAGAALALGLLLLIERLRVSDPIARERTRLLAPGTPREYVMFCGLAVSAGIVEQLAYRGVLFSFLLWYTGSFLAAAMLAGVPFGLVHLFQGWRSAFVVIVIALRDQILVALTGTLVFAIVIHIIHDVIAGTVLMRRVRREESLLAVS